jgi:hypothetical protein
MILEAESCPPHVLVMDTGNAWVTGDGTLENIPRPSKAASTTRGVEPLLGISPVSAHILSITIASLGLAGKDVVMDTVSEGAVLVVDATGWPDCVTLYHDAASDIR